MKSKSTHTPCSHILKSIFNVVSGQCASPDINVHNALEIGLQQAEEFIQKIPTGFHSKIEKKVKTMHSLKKAIVVQGRVVHDLEAIFARLQLVGQQ